MGRGSAAFAALGAAFALALPAPAQAQASEAAAPAERQEPTRFAGPHADPNFTLGDALAPPSELATRLVETVPMADGVDLDLGVGLFSVVGETESKSRRRRTDPRIGVGSAETRVAAIGVSMRF